MFQSEAGTKRKPAANVFTLSGQTAFAVAALLCLLLCHSPAFAQKTQTKSAPGVNRKPKASYPPKPANAPKTKEKDGPFKQFRVTAKFDPIPVVPVTNVVIALDEKRVKTLRDILTMTIEFETDENLVTTGLKAKVKVRLRKITDIAQDEDKENKVINPSYSIDDITQEKPPCIKKNGFRYRLTVTVDPDNDKNGPWAKGDNVRVTVKYNRGTAQNPDWVAGVAHGTLE